MYKVKVLKDTMIILAISFTLLVVSELMLRIIFPEKLMDTPKKSAYEVNKDYLISLKPNIKKTFVRSDRNGGDIIHWRTNSNSFRGAELLDNPKTRIIVYGDSNIQARFSKDENTYAVKLKNYLIKTGVTDIEVVNAGVIGFGPDQSLIRFEKEADHYKPDMVIFHICADNDFGDVLRNRLFKLDPNHGLKETGDRNTLDDHLDAVKRRKFISSLLIVRAAKKLARIIKPSLRNGKEERLNLLQRLVDEEFSVYKGGQPGEHFDLLGHYDLDVALDPDKESSKTKINLMEAILKKANIVALSKGIKLLIVIQPSVIDLTKGNAVLDYEYLQRYPKYRRTNLSDAVKNISVANNINYINLYEVFVKNDPENLFFRDGDDHWNDQGQDIAAKETASYIVNRKMIE